jgi:hypothetical protein
MYLCVRYLNIYVKSLCNSILYCQEMQINLQASAVGNYFKIRCIINISQIKTVFFTKKFITQSRKNIINLSTQNLILIILIN